MRIEIESLRISLDMDSKSLRKREISNWYLFNFAQNQKILPLDSP